MPQLRNKQLEYPLSGSFTGSLLGTASYADNSTSASFVVSSSYSVSSSQAQNATTASYALVSKPAGNSKEIQYNNGGVMSADVNLTFDATKNILFVGKTNDAPYSNDLKGGFVQGNFNIIEGEYSQAQGLRVSALGTASRAQGTGSVSLGDYSQASGEGVIASGSAQTVIGKYNTHGNDTAFFVIGNGTDDSTRTDLAVFGPNDIYVSGSIFLETDKSYSVTADKFFGDLIGNASTANTATNADTASFVTGSNVYGPYGSNSVVSASYAQSSSQAENATTASHALTASYVANASSFPFTGSAIITGSLIVTGSTISTGGFTGSLFGTASFVTSASYAITSSYSVSSSYSLSSSYSVSSSYVLSSSYSVSSSQAQNAVSASYALNGGVTQIFAGANITIGPTTGVGQVTISSTGGGGSSFNTATGSYGSFYDTTTQTNPVGNIPRSMSLDTTDITNGVSISGSTNPFNTYIKTENAGVYNIQFSAQVEKTDSGTDEIVIWLRKNGTNLTDTATTITLVGNSTKAVAAWNWFVTSAANDYYQIIWISADTGMRLLAETISGTHPGIPSVIVTVNRVDQFLSNTGSFSGSFTGNLIGTSSFATTASYVQTAQTASYVINAVSSSFASTASYVTASNVYGPFGSNSVISSSYALTASYALTSAGGGSGAGFPFTGSAVITGSLIVTGSATFTDSILIDSTLVTSSIVTTTGAATTTISTQATGSYRSMFAKYTVSNSTNARAGEFMAVWNAGNIQFTDTSTTDIGDTSALVLTGSLTATNVELSTGVGTGWTVKTQTTYV